MFGQLSLAGRNGPKILRPQEVFAIRQHSGGADGKQILSGFRPDFAWIKETSTNSYNHSLADRQRGVDSVLSSSLSWSEGQFKSQAPGTYVTSFDERGITLGTRPEVNSGGLTYVDYLLREAKNFFVIVSYNGNGASGRAIPHGLGIKPGMIVVKQRDGNSSWPVWHAGLPFANYMYLDRMAARTSSFNGSFFGNGSAVDPTDVAFTVGNDSAVNASGSRYTAYLFAHDPRQTGLIRCGSFTQGSGSTAVYLGWRPQYVLFRRSNNTNEWNILDASRGWAENFQRGLYANSSHSEQDTRYCYPTESGMIFTGYPAGDEIIYMAIRAPF